jgi:hypothetical protein
VKLLKGIFVLEQPQMRAYVSLPLKFDSSVEITVVNRVDTR